MTPRASSIPCFAFDTYDLPPGGQFAAWHDSFAPILELNQIDALAAGFEGRQLLWDLGSLVLARIRTDAVTFAGLAGRTRGDPLDHWVMTFLLRGKMSTRTPTRTFDANTGSVQVHTLSRSFEGSTTNSEMLMLFVPRDFCPEVERVLDATEFSAFAGGMGRLLFDYIIGVAKRLPMLDMQDLPSLVAAMRAMILACTTRSADHIKDGQEPITATLFARARRFIQSKLFDATFDAETLRREMGISRTRLYRLFEPYGGVAHYIQHRRLIDAHLALTDPGDQRLIAEIAEQRGFSDGTEFSRAFKREFGYSPSDVRKGGKNSAPSKPFNNLHATLPEERLGKVLRQLHG